MPSPRTLRPAAVLLAAAAALAASLSIAAAPASAAGVSLSVDTSSSRHAISPLIYGMNGAVPSLADELDLPVDRWGGNLFETYNFTLGAVNTAADYFYENIGDCFYFDTGCGSGNTPYYRSFVSTDVARGTAPLMQLPMAGYVAKNAPTNHPFTCGFPVAANGANSSGVGAQHSADPYDSSCGDGVKSSDGSNVTSDPTRDGVAITDADRASWVTDLASRGAHLFELGNEPNLWADTHRDIHPAATTYDELWSKSRTLANAVKDHDPQGQVVGFSEWGWPNYFCSEADVDHANGYCGDGHNTDRAAHGNVPLVNWLLQQFKAQSTSEGRRLLDYVDVHYYAQGFDSADPMDVTRSLWDPTFTDPSYIDDQIDLIPRMHDWVNTDYPGTKISISEYDLLDAALTGRQNAIIEADTLGIFGREGVDLATFWDEGHGGATVGAGTSPTSPVANAFRMFRNYDGQHHGFGDTSIASTSTDQDKLAIYGATRSDGALTILVLNKTASPITAPLTLSGGPSAVSSVQTYAWTGGSIVRAADRAALPTSAAYPAQSMTLYVVAPAAPAVTPTPTAAPTPTGTPVPVGGSAGGNPAGNGTPAPGLSTTAPAVAPTLIAATTSEKQVATGDPVTFSATTSAPGTVKIVITTSTAGRKVSGACKPQTAKNKTKKSCHYDRVITTLTQPATGGKVTVTFSGKVGKKKLAAGTYKATITTTATNGLTSAATVITFKVTAKKK